MVGVAGRSKGCHTCRKRRIKCDEGKPTCARCSKAGYTCAGYEKKLQFRHTYAEEVKDGAPKDKDKQPSPETIILLNLAHSRERSVQEQQHQALGRPPAQELSLVAFQPNIEFSFLFDHFVWRTYGTPWLDLAAAGKLGDLSASASRSLAQSTFGQSYHQPAIELSGAIHYSKTLKSLIPRLEDPKKPGIEMLIVPIMIMLNRASTQADTAGALSHVKGLIQVLNVCGPEKFQKRPLLDAFESVRAMLTLNALMTIRRSFLEEEKWLTVPWALELGPKRPQSQLLDILVYVPGLLEDKKILDSSDHNLHPNLHTTLLNNVITRLTDLFEWRWRWQAQNPNSVRTLAVPTPTQRARRRPPELPVLEFASTLHSGELILYNLVLLWLLNLLWTLAPPSSISSILSTAASSALSLLNLSRSFSYQPSHPFIHTSPPSTFPLRPPGKITHLRIAAIEIARCFEYQIESIKTARVNLLFFMMPLGLARSVLQDEDKYLDWIIDMVASTRFTRAYAQSTSTNAFGFKFGFRFGFESGQGGGSDPNNIKGGAPGPLTADKIDGGGNGLTAESNSTETPKYNIMGSIVSTPKSSNPGSSRGGSIPKSSNYGSSRGESIPIIEGPTPSDGGSEGLRVPTSNQTPQEPMEFMPCSPQRKAVLTASYGMVGDGTPHMMGIGTSTAESQSGIGTGYPATPTTLGDGRYGHGLATPETSPGFTPGDTSTAANFEGAEDSTGHMGIPEPNPVLGHTGGEVYPSGGESRGFGY